jgi:polyhydroxyalkanoate synthesis repressor PhaR
MPTSEQPHEAAADEVVSIVRYPNRRLYDRSQACYVTLLDIAAMVRDGKVVNVRDSKTNEDLTSMILTQIILEHHPERMELLPVPVLHLMLRTNGVVLDLLREYFRQSLAYLDFWERASTFNPMASSIDWLQSLMPRRSAAEGPPAAGSQSQGEILAQRLVEMERRLQALEPTTDKNSAATGDAAEPGAAIEGRRAPRRSAPPRGKDQGPSD